MLLLRGCSRADVQAGRPLSSTGQCDRRYETLALQNWLGAPVVRKKAESRRLCPLSPNRRLAKRPAAKVNGGKGGDKGESGRDLLYPSMMQSAHAPQGSLFQ